MPAAKKYVCAFCARAFTRLEHKQRHERSHTNEKPFHCLYCTSAFVRRDLLQRHCRTVHNIKLVSRSKREKKDSLKEDELSEPLNGKITHPPPLAPPLVHAPAKPVELRSPNLDVHVTPTGPAPQRAPTLLPGSAAPLTSLRLLHTQTSQDPLHLLSISKNLSNVYDSTDTRYPCHDMFLVGHSVLSLERYAIFANSLALLIDQLHNISGQSLSDFRLGQVYSILAVGALSMPLKDYDPEELATSFINKLWNIVVDKLNSAHSSLPAQCDVLKNLFLLTYIYLRFFNNDLMVSYLEDLAHIILQNLASLPSDAELVSQNLELFWSIYVLVLKYKANEAPPKFYSWFLASKLHRDSPVTLAQAVKAYLIQLLPLQDPLLLEVVICTLSNEVNNLIFNKSLWLFDLLNSLHNAIVLANKSMVLSAPDTSMDIFNVFRSKLVLGAAPTYEELLQAHVFKISEPHHWNMLLLTLREFNAPFSFNNFMRENLMLSFQNFGNSLLGFFTFELQTPPPSLNSYENLGIISFSLIFQYNFLRLNNVEPPFQIKNLSIVDLANLNNLILEWYITIVKVMVTLITKRSAAEAEEVVRRSNVLSCLFYMINSNCASTPAFASTEFYLQVFEELTKICDTWFNFINKSANLHNLRMNLNRFLNDLVVLALNNDSISLGDLYVANESILIRNRRSKSIGSMDSTPSNRSSLSSSFPPPVPSHRGSSTNYVLMNKPENDAGSPQPLYSTQMSPSSLLAPLQGVTKLNFLSPAGPRVQKPLAQPMNSPPVPPSSTYVLPPIYAAVKDHAKPEGMK